MTPKGIVLHLSASTFGDSEQIDQWHRAQGWSGIGYHFVILNGKRHSTNLYDRTIDGSIEIGRAENIKGAHCKANSMNECTIGICKIGNPNQLISGAVSAPSDYVENKYLTNSQLDSLLNKSAQLCLKYKLDPSATFVHPTTGATHPVITQHSQHENGKPLCASLNIYKIRQAIVKRHQMISKGLMADTELSVLEEAYLMEDPKSVENELPEFKAPLGGSSGPPELDVDVKEEIYQ